MAKHLLNMATNSGKLMELQHRPVNFPSISTREYLNHLLVLSLYFGDVNIRLVEIPLPYTAARMKAYKSTDSYIYFLSGYINNAAVWEVKDKKSFTVIAKVSATVGKK